jgi:hypothetical protein
LSLSKRGTRAVPCAFSLNQNAAERTLPIRILGQVVSPAATCSDRYYLLISGHPRKSAV